MNAAVTSLLLILISIGLGLLTYFLARKTTAAEQYFEEYSTIAEPIQQWSVTPATPRREGQALTLITQRRPLPLLSISSLIIVFIIACFVLLLVITIRPWHLIERTPLTDSSTLQDGVLVSVLADNEGRHIDDGDSITVTVHAVQEPWVKGGCGGKLRSPSLTLMAPGFDKQGPVLDRESPCAASWIWVMVAKHPGHQVAMIAFQASQSTSSISVARLPLAIDVDSNIGFDATIGVIGAILVGLIGLFGALRSAPAK
ncbi:MAG TPA: hypothetical protein VN934_05765 [Candidatus Tumulicola sp.]|nr:hypothetical protein [Candidatus Tumulicola sp.]